jgi:Carboxypeptidase regulatory-like domain
MAMPRCMTAAWCRVGLILVILSSPISPAHAWGPHTEITLAALAVIPARERLARQFGEDWLRQARDYCWMGDWREAVRPDHYADDYLLFRRSPTHPSHMLPEVRQTFAPFFRRALQALRTESPRNAARWIGSLLHFMQDAGSPPHTTGIGGDLHGKMEQWVDASRISIADYEPRLLGRNYDDALRGFEARMEALIEFSRERAVRLKPLVEALRERENQPLALECALETARVTADVLHTLYVLGLETSATEGCRLEGSLDYKPLTGYAAVPARVWLPGTDFSTTTDDAGEFVFRNLPAGRFDVVVLATGFEFTKIANVDLTPGETTQLAIKLLPDPTPRNLVRNPTFQSVSLREGAPDWWVRDPVHTGRWSSALIRVPIEKACDISVQFIDDIPVPVAIRWRANPSTSSGGREETIALAKQPDSNRFVAAVTPPAAIVPFEKGMLFLELRIDCGPDPRAACRHVAVTLSNP